LVWEPLFCGRAIIPSMRANTYLHSARLCILRGIHLARLESQMTSKGQPLDHTWREIPSRTISWNDIIRCDLQRK
jgi:hypothetical protein